MTTKFTKEPAPPPQMFLGSKEKDLVAQINQELLERIIGQEILYYPIDYETTNFHPLYDEAVIKNFLPPVRVYALVRWDGQETETAKYGIDKRSKLLVNFHKRRLTEDQNLFVREGDFVLYGELFYEIVKLNEPRQLFGKVDSKFEIAATCIRSRHGLFSAH